MIFSFESLRQENTNTSMDRNKPDETKHRLSFDERRRRHRQQWNMDQYAPTRPSREVVSHMQFINGTKYLAIIRQNRMRVHVGDIGNHLVICS